MANLFGRDVCERYLVGMSRRPAGEVEVVEDKAPQATAQGKMAYEKTPECRN